MARNHWTWVLGTELRALQCVLSHRAISPVAIPQIPYLNNVPGFAFPAKLFRYVIINTTLALEMAT